MDERDQEQAWQRQDELDMQQQILEALKASQSRPLTEDEAMALAYSAGLASDFYKGIRL